MKRPFLLLPAAVVVGALAFGAAYWAQTRSAAPSLAASGTRPELAWIRQEFHLSEAQFARVAALHEAYKPTCARLCQRIAEQNEQLREAVSRTNALTDDLRALVAETGKARDECRQAMLEHLYAVAREMPPDDGRRYLQVMLGATCVLQNARTIDAIQPGQSAPAHVHHE